MPDKADRERLKKKALERWENEGGKINGAVESGSPAKPPGKDNERQTPESPKLDQGRDPRGKR